jgi:hypothetical protein
MEDPQSVQQDPISNLLAEFGTRINEIEEKQRLIKDRILLIGENLISTKEDIEKQNLEFKKQMKQTEAEIKSVKQITGRIVNELSSLARASELEILERQMKMFQPLEFARISDVQNMILEEAKKLDKGKS